jgi:hypothetical protein
VTDVVGIAATSASAVTAPRYSQHLDRAGRHRLRIANKLMMR